MLNNEARADLQIGMGGIAVPVPSRLPCCLQPTAGQKIAAKLPGSGRKTVPGRLQPIAKPRWEKEIPHPWRVYKSTHEIGLLDEIRLGKQEKRAILNLAKTENPYRGSVQSTRCRDSGADGDALSSGCAHFF
jgi:hypothetical protein